MGLRPLRIPARPDTGRRPLLPSDATQNRKSRIQNDMNLKSITARTLIVFAALVAPPAPAQMSGHHAHPPLPDQKYVFQCRIESGDEAQVVAAPLRLAAPTTAATLDQAVELPAPHKALRLGRFLPRAELEQRVVPADGTEGRAAIELLVEGPTQTHRLWLVANDPDRNQLVSLIGTWRYMAVDDEAKRDELRAQFRTEFTRPPLLRVSRADGSALRELTAKAGEVHEVADFGCTVRVLRFFPDFGIDRDSNEPVNRSEQRLNPAALVRLEREGQQEERWVFAKFPDFKAQPGKSLPYRVTLDCPVASKAGTPDFVVITVAGRTHEAWTRRDGEVKVLPLDLEARIDVGTSQYTFQLAKFVAHGRLIEEYRASDKKSAVPALEVELPDQPTGARTVWLELGARRAVGGTDGRLVLWFGPGEPEGKGHGSPP